MADPALFLPEPKHLVWRPEPFALNRATVIAVPSQPGATTLREARRLQNTIASVTGLRLAIQPGPLPAPPGSISLRMGELAAGDLPFTIAPAVTEQAFTITVAADHVSVMGGGGSGLAYGVSTLTQLVAQCGRRWPGLTLADAPALPVRGLMLDVSRGKVPTLATLISLVTTLAAYRYNQLQLYVEHTFAFPRHPAIGAGADPLTADDILALDACCREHHIDLVPNLQAIGHQAVMLSLPQYQHLAETPWNWSLASTSDEGFALMGELFDDLLPAFSSSYVNINGDEPWDLGRGQSKARADTIGIGRVYLDHVRRLHEMVTARGRTMMMWADMFWHHPELVAEFPPDIVLLDWWYERKERHDSVDVIAAAGRRFYVCPGTSSWLTLYPRLENAIANIQTFVRDGVAAGAEGMLLTDWGDQGHFQPLSNSWYPYLWGAACGWTGGRTTSEAFDAAFSQLFLDDASGRQVAAMRRLGAATQTAADWHHSWHTAMALWEDPITSKQASRADAAATTNAIIAAAAAIAVAPEMGDPMLRHDFGFAAAQIDFAARKVETTRAIRQALRDAAPPGEVTDDLVNRFTSLLATLAADRDTAAALAGEFEDRWRAHARESQLVLSRALWQGLLQRYETAIAWFTDQCAILADGRPVDSELLTYDDSDYAVLHDARWQEIQALIDIVGLAQLPPDLQEYVATHQPATKGTATT